MMHIIIWEYHVTAEHVAEFENIYSANGAWAGLFRKTQSYLGTELLRDPNSSYRYITIDRWSSSQDFELFLSQYKTEYATLDTQCEGLTEKESLLGRWESILPETR